MESTRFYRPVRGAVRLKSFTWNVEQIRKELELLSQGDWKNREYGSNWSDVALFVKGKGSAIKSHSSLDEAPGLRAVLTAFPAPPVDMCLAALEPGGNIKEHRDISGGTAANITRLHIPIITHDRVSFFISGHRVVMAEGEVWHLDTTYRHRVSNDSDITRIHLILDLEDTPELQAMLPKRDWADRLHTAYFGLICIGKAVQLLASNPRAFIKRCRDFVRLRVKRESVLYNEDDLK